jgi:hypothetical protein
MDKVKAIVKEVATNAPFLVVGVILVLIGSIGLVPLGTTKYQIRDPWQWILLFIGVVLIAIDGVRYLRTRRETGVPLDNVGGEIRRPSKNDEVMTAIDTEGQARDVEKNQHLWLVIEVGNHKWPKAGEIHADKEGSWRHTVFEDGTGDRFSLSLFVADDDGHKKIGEWLDIGALIGYHPFELAIPGTRRLARVEGLRLRK